MHLRFTRAARKHKIGKSRVRYVIENPLVTIQIPAGDDQPDNRTLYLGDDESGRAFEVLTVPIEDGELVIHAMDMRAKYRPVYDAAKEGESHMNAANPDDSDYDPAVDELLHDARGNPIDADYIDGLNREAEIGYDVEKLAQVRVGRPSLSEAGDSPQVRFRLSADTRAEAAALAAREGKTLSQLARDAVEAYLTARRSA